MRTGLTRGERTNVSEYTSKSEAAGTNDDRTAGRLRVDGDGGRCRSAPSRSGSCPALSLNTKTHPIPPFLPPYQRSPRVVEQRGELVITFSYQVHTLIMHDLKEGR